MSSVFALIAKMNLPIFDKGDIVTYQENRNDFGEKIKDNPKFIIVEVVGATVEEAEALVLPLTVNSETEHQYEYKARMISVNIDAIGDERVFDKSVFMSYLSRKKIDTSQNEDVIV